MGVGRGLELGPSVRAGQHAGHHAGAGPPSRQQVAGGVAHRGHGGDVVDLQREHRLQDHVRMGPPAQGRPGRQGQVDEIGPAERRDDQGLRVGREAGRQTEPHARAAQASQRGLGSVDRRDLAALHRVGDGPLERERRGRRPRSSSPSSARNTSIFDSPIDEWTNARWSAIAGIVAEIPVDSMARTKARSTSPSSRTVVPAMSSTASSVGSRRSLGRVVAPTPVRRRRGWWRAPRGGAAWPAAATRSACAPRPRDR